jgi:glutathione synthase/RimK-type ligase-like ATP-grasp enzyme
MKSIALVTYSQYPKLTDSDCLIAPLILAKNIDVQAVPWDNPAINWQNYDLIVVRSCWNYQHHYAEFMRWLDLLDTQRCRVFNTTTDIRWNSDKLYLQDLAKKDIPIVPTIYLDGHQPIDLENIWFSSNWEQIVIKPSIGASAYLVSLFTKKEISQAKKHLNKIFSDSNAIIQPFVSLIKEGEWSIVFIDNEYCHAVRKIPQKGEFRTNFRYHSHIECADLPNIVKTQVIEIYRKLGKDLLYARMDIVLSGSEVMVMELELIEPYLFFDYYPGNAAKFAHAIIKRVEK